MAGVNERHRKRTRAREGGEFRAGEKYEAGEGKREREKERERERERTAPPAAGSQLPVRLGAHRRNAKGTECTGGVPR